MKPILEVKGISKKFKIQHEKQQYLSLRDSISNIFTRKNNSEEEFWALKNISFDIYPGDSVGIIGRNGAGKSTLLKILSKITPPTSGNIISRGRIASLLEVGTGFHTELSGRENIYLNGSILGLKRKEIDKHFDAIIDFSGVEKFLDTPLKHYSSGMQLRLAFAVAAHLEPEILIIDEVLAVGDNEFQKKCMGKMNEVTKSGRTILFVSHNMGAISSLCNKSIMLNSGNIEGYSDTGSIVAKYYSSSTNAAHSFDLTNTNERHGDEVAELIAGYVKNKSNEKKNRFFIDEEVFVCMKYRIKKKIDAPIVPNFHFYNGQGECIFTINAPNVTSLEPGVYEATCSIPTNFLNDGMHFVLLAATTYFQNNYEVNFAHKDALSFEIVDKLHDNPLRYNYVGPMPGYIRPSLKFDIEKI